MSAAAVINVRINMIMRHLRQCGATSPGSAVPLSDVPYSNRWYFRRLVRFGAIVQEGDSCYLDEERAKEYQRARIGRALIFLFICFLAFFVIWLMGGFR